MFDYIIIGAGSAGCVLANRLSHDPSARVLLLEAGGPDTARDIHIPAAFGRLFKTPVDWAFYTEPQQALGGRKLYWPRGKMLGGCSSMNAMIYIRGNRLDYDRWAQSGAAGWDWASVHLLFEQTLLNLSVTSLHEVNPLSNAFVNAAVEAGFRRNYDFNGTEQDGFGFYRVTQSKGRRHSAADAFLHSEKGRANLTVQTGALVTNIVIEGGRARGVRAAFDGKTEELRAEREVVVCAGAVNSPQILMLSGIGPADHLRAVGVTPVVDAPGVGGNLQDHLAVPVCFRSKRPVSLADAGSMRNMMRYLISHKGPLTSNVAEAGGFIRTEAGLDRPNVQFHFAPAYFIDHGFKQVEGHGFTIGPTLVRPESRGHVRLRSANPAEAPAIQPNCLEADADVTAMTEGIRVARRIAQMQAMAPFRGDEHCPGDAVSSDEALAAYLRSEVQTLYHPVGTCRMGTDDGAVVDPQLRVRGVEGLRVADASVMPEIVTGNTNAAAMMIGEKAAAMMLGRLAAKGAVQR